MWVHGLGVMGFEFKVCALGVLGLDLQLRVEARVIGVRAYWTRDLGATV